MTTHSTQQSNQRSSTEPELSLSAARAVIWQTSPKRPMGDLLYEGQLTREDLVWAIRKAFRPEVRAAAQVLLADLDCVDQPPMLPSAQPTAPRIQPSPSPLPTFNAAPEPRYGPQVIAASSYLADQEENHLGALGIAVGVGVMFVLYALYETVRSLAAGQSINVGSGVSFLLGLALCGWYIRRYATAWRNMQLGRQGEERIVDALRSALDSRWTIYRNVQLADNQADLDLVLVGPDGVWAVQVKNYRVPLRYQNGWQCRRGGQWVACAAKLNPEAQVKLQAQSLSDYLAKQGITRWVEPAIALAAALPEKDVVGSPVPVWLPFSVERHARSLATRTPPSAEEVAQINTLLGKRASEQRAVEEDRRKRGK